MGTYYKKAKLQIKQQILNYLNKIDWVSTNEIKKVINKNWDYTRNILNELKEEKKIQKVKISNMLMWKKGDEK